jgi:hypothetical protein
MRGHLNLLVRPHCALGVFLLKKFHAVYLGVQLVIHSFLTQIILGFHPLWFILLSHSHFARGR